MALTTYIPGMEAGRTLRNTVVFVLYVVCFPLVPAVLAFAVFSNYNRVADRLARRDTPGFSPGGGVMPAAVTFFALTVVVLLVISLGVAPFVVLGDAGGSDSPAENDTEGDADKLSVDQEANETDALNDGGFGGDSFLGDSEGGSGEELSEDEKAANTLAVFEDMLREKGYEVTNGAISDGVMHIEYISYAEERESLSEEIVDITVEYVMFDNILQNEFAEEYDGKMKEKTDGLRVTISDYEGEEQGSYSVDGEWARNYYSGDISNEEFQDKIEGTMQITNNFEEDNNDNNSSN
ncbi:hypothetical protein [Saliphagus infecundisoli]|uniref:DUF8159 domain-containing protein n=1 Tax=Saliphagus infecundisoli TaxID=1849069 RepID=A0ABD5Q989_9EURY|nr:hypothetical protein [Saliphagus infecundisoli]